MGCIPATYLDLKHELERRHLNFSSIALRVEAQEDRPLSAEYVRQVLHTWWGRQDGLIPRGERILTILETTKAILALEIGNGHAQTVRSTKDAYEDNRSH
jgi:phosphoketolase